LDKRQALKEIIDFVGDSLVVGHNVSFDIAILEENANRVKEKFSVTNFYDTLDLAKRYLVAPNYKLETLSRLLGLHQAVHNAEDDVLASFELLVRLMPELTAGSDSRAKLFAANSKKFISLASAIGRWQLLAKVKRPAELLSIILEESGLWDYYSDDQAAERRLKSFDTLKRLFTELDDADLTPKEAIVRMLSYGSLVKNIDFLGLDEGKIPVITIHQVKGLEFDYVFMPMLNEGIFPTTRKNNDFLEEKRVFYVGLTRAKKGLYLSWNQFDDYNRPRVKSRFLAYFDNLS